jgi:hypothetical protein
MIMMIVRTGVVGMVVATWSVAPVFACWAGARSPQTLVAEADVIVRVRAVEEQPVDGSFPPFDKTVNFIILEQLKGKDRLFDLRGVTGTLLDRSDFNDRPVPYDFVRRGGRAGSCYARSYQKGGEYLLLLKSVEETLTPYWAPLSATNEQVTGADDTWVAWVRAEVRVTAR